MTVKEKQCDFVLSEFKKHFNALYNFEVEVHKIKTVTRVMQKFIVKFNDKATNNIHRVSFDHNSVFLESYINNEWHGVPIHTMFFTIIRTIYEGFLTTDF